MFDPLATIIRRVMVTGCAWGGTARLADCETRSSQLIDPGSTVNWLEAYDPELVNSPAWERYTVSLYWAIITISTMGYGDVLPVNTNERIFSIGVALIGAVVFSYSMGNITSLISQTAGADVKFDEKLRFVEVREPETNDATIHCQVFLSQSPQSFPTNFDSLASNARVACRARRNGSTFGRCRSRSSDE